MRQAAESLVMTGFMPIFFPLNPFQLFDFGILSPPPLSRYICLPISFKDKPNKEFLSLYGALPRSIKHLARIMLIISVLPFLICLVQKIGAFCILPAAGGDFTAQ